MRSALDMRGHRALHAGGGAALSGNMAA
jgi:hypothetical protein